MKSTLKIALGALVFTYLFFFEYLSPFRWVHIQYDLDGFHYPLMDYGFRALKEGRLPQWDITFSGISYAGNPQAALFYPGTWVLYAANWRHDHLSYTSLEVFVVAHLWLAFVLGYFWLRHGRQVAEFPAMLGATVIAFSGFACSQMQHLGLIVACAWTPLVLLGIDRRWLATTAFASTLAFLGGYTPSWAVLALFALIYGLCQSWRAGLHAVLALAASLMLAMVQLLPTLYLLNTKIPDNRYGSGVGLPFLLSYFIPNFYDFGMEIPAGTNFPNECVYLGAPCLFGLACLLWRRQFRDLLPVLAPLLACLILLLNPFNWIAPLVEQFSLLRQLCRSFYFTAGVTVALAALAAHGLDAFFRANRRAPRWLGVVLLGTACAWGIFELARWHSGHFAPRYSYESLVTLTLFAACAFTGPPVRAGITRTLVCATLLFCAFADYKAFGTSKRFNAAPGPYRTAFTPTGFAEMDDDAYQELKRHPEFRVLADIYLNPLQLRHFDLATPQGFDPFLPRLYEQELRKRNADFRSNWEFGIAPENIDLLQHLGVRYWITTESSALYLKLKALPRFQELGKEPRYFRVFMDSQSRSVASDAEVLEWTPEHRKLRVTGPRIATLAENRLPGWHALLDGQPSPIAADHEFQAVSVPEGAHILEFRYQTEGLVAGTWISGLSAIVLILIGGRRQRLQ